MPYEEQGSVTPDSPDYWAQQASGQPDYSQQPAAQAWQQPQNPYVQTAAPAAAYAPAPVRQATDGKAVGALICGILGIVLCFLPPVGGILAIIAIALGVASRKSADSRGLAIGGLVTGIVGVVIALLLTVFTAMILTELYEDNPFDGYELEELMEDLDGYGLGDDFDLDLDQEFHDQAVSGTFEDPDDQAIYDCAVEKLDVVCNPTEDAKRNLADSVNESARRVAGSTLEEMGVDPLDLVEWVTVGATYEVTAVETSEQGMGQVSYTSRVRDMNELMQCVGDKVDEYVDSRDYQNDSREERAQMFGQIMNEAMNEVTDTVENHGTVALQKFDGKWALTKDSLNNLPNDFYGTYWG